MLKKDIRNIYRKKRAALTASVKNKLEDLMLDSDAGMSSFSDILLYRRNANWVMKLKTLMAGKSLLVAVGAGHLPGEKGVISLLRKAGFTVTPVENKRIRTKEI